MQLKYAYSVTPAQIIVSQSDGKKIVINYGLDFIHQTKGEAKLFARQLIWLLKSKPTYIVNRFVPHSHKEYYDAVNEWQAAVNEFESLLIERKLLKDELKATDCKLTASDILADIDYNKIIRKQISLRIKELKQKKYQSHCVLTKK